jgi:diaminobutyrate-2-oxoglutarate transaminase
MNSKVFEQYESEVRSYCRSFPTVFKRAKGAVLTDEDGRDYIDFFCGAGALNYGHNPDYIKEKLIDYLSRDGVTHGMDMYTEAKRAFIDYFETNILKPRGLNYKIQFTGPTGTNAVEAALKLARKVTKRSTIVALMGAFHGMTLGSLALTCDRSSRAGAGVPLTNVVHIPAPYMFPQLDVVDYLETLLTDDHSGLELPAAVILETVQADGGIYVFDVEFLQRLRALCDKYDILLITDDIQVGCARTGTYFSFERAGIVPDIVTMSKSIGGYGLPMAITLFKPELDVWEPGEHTGTFRGNQLAFIAAKAGMEMMLNQHIEARVQRLGKTIGAFLESEVKPLDSRIEIRGIGFMWGIDFGKFDGDMTKPLIAECFSRGLIAERVGRNNAVLKIMPPLVIEEDTLKKGLAILKEAVQAILVK